MPELRQKNASQEEPVRVVERDGRDGREGRNETMDVHELERRVSSLQNDVAHLAQLGMRLTQSAPFGGFAAGFGPVVPGAVPPAPTRHAGAPLFGYGVPSYHGVHHHVPPEAVTMREFGATPPVMRQPGVNIVDAGEEYVVQVEIPATKKKDLELLGSERAITVSAQVRPDPEAEGTILLAEMAPTVYRRTIHLPAACNTARSKASLKDGILTLNVPKRDPADGMRRIDVAYG